MQSENTHTLDGLALLPEGLRHARIQIESGSIASVEEVDAVVSGRKIIFPGFIDLHVHVREYWQARETDPESQAVWDAMIKKEDFTTAGCAAINGGVTLFVAMPNDPDPPDNELSYTRKEGLSASSACPAVLAAAVTRTSEPWEDILYKIYLDPRPSPVSFDRWDDFRAAVARYSGCRMLFHAEDPEFIVKQGNAGPRWKTRPPEAEFRAVARILDLTARFGLKSHICHVSTRKAVELITSYNEHSSTKVTTEATPHHLFFSVFPEGVLGAMGSPDTSQEMFECNPPIRPEEDRLFLVESLRTGLVDCLASDHAPHTTEDKMRGAPGMPHLDTLGPFVGWLISDGGFTPTRIGQIISGAPASILRPVPEKRLGSIRKGFSANFTILDMDLQSRVIGSEIAGRGPLKTRCAWSPFSGYTFDAWVCGTVIDGKHYRFEKTSC